MKPKYSDCCHHGIEHFVGLATDNGLEYDVYFIPPAFEGDNPMVCLRYGADCEAYESPYTPHLKYLKTTHPNCWLLISNHVGSTEERIDELAFEIRQCIDSIRSKDTLDCVRRTLIDLQLYAHDAYCAL